MDFDKHRKSQVIEVKDITKYLKTNGFSNIKIQQQWRHLTGSVVKKGNVQFFKLASTVEVAERTKNEFEWNNLINNANKLTISVPKNYESGYYGGLFWFTSEFADGTLLANVSQKKKTNNLEDNLKNIALTVKDILNIKTDKRLPNDKKEIEEENDIQKVFLDRLKHWMGQFDNNVEDLYKFIENRMKYAKIAPSHGDFVPWHILTSSRNKLILIDGEHSRIEGFKFYDAAYFYHRVYTKLKRPDIADKFLEEFNKIYPFSKDDKECFRLILAQRVIGGYMDAKYDSSTSVKHQNGLMNKILKDKLIIS